MDDLIAEIGAWNACSEDMWGNGFEAGISKAVDIIKRRQMSGERIIRTPEIVRYELPENPSAEEETLAQIQFVMEVNNHAQAIRLLEQLVHRSKPEISKEATGEYTESQLHEYILFQIGCGSCNMNNPFVSEDGDAEIIFADI